MNGYVPIKLPFNSFEPSEGADEKLNPVIFLHGILLSKVSWDDIPQTIADKTKRKTYTYDARNHGDTEHTNEFNFDLNVDDLFHFMDSMNIKKAVLVGHSMGGHTAFKAALRKPERVESIIVEDMPVKKIPAQILNSVIVFIDVMRQALKSVPSDLDERDVTKYVINQMLIRLPESLSSKEKYGLIKTNWDFKRESDGAYDVKFNFNVLKENLKNSNSLMSELSGKFNGSTYFLTGSLYTLKKPSEQNYVRKFFPNAIFTHFEGATHNVHVDIPEKFKETIACFLK